MMNRKSHGHLKSVIRCFSAQPLAGSPFHALGLTGRAGGLGRATAHCSRLPLGGAAFAVVMSAAVGICAQATLSLVKSVTPSAAEDSIVVGSASYLLDLRINTAGNAVSGLQYYIETAPAAATIYGAAPLTVLSNPFLPSDVAVAPAAGAIVSQSGGTTVLFKASGEDYPAFANNAIATYQLNTRNLPPGTYVFTAVGEELSNANTTVTTFGASGSFTLTILADADGDGMPNTYELANSLNPSSSADAADDTDGDGVSNLWEYLAATNPRNSASVLRAGIQWIGGSVRISFVASANKIYQLESNDHFASGWTVVAANITRSNDGVLLVNDPAATVAKRFYRVRVMR